MAVEISADYPNYPKDVDLDLGGVLVKNGGSTKLDDDQELALATKWGAPIKEGVGESEYVKVSGGKVSASDLEKLQPVSAEPPVNPYVEAGDVDAPRRKRQKQRLPKQSPQKGVKSKWH